MSFAVYIEKIKKAIEFEENAAYSDLLGQKETFSQFMYKTFGILFSNHQITLAQELSKKYKLYSSMDLPSRMQLIKNTKANLSDLHEKTKPEPQSNLLYETDIKWVVGVGTLLAKTLNKLGIFTVQDLICYWPRKHLNFSQRVYIRDLKVGMEATIIGLITKVNAFQSPRNPNLGILNIRITDPTGTVSLNKFVAGRSNKFLLESYRKQFPVNSLVMVSGCSQFDKSTRYQLTNFSVELLDEQKENSTESLEVGRLVPIYGLTEGLSQSRLRKIIYNAFEKFKNKIEETLPEHFNLMSFKEAAFQMHFPESEASLEKAKERIVFEEFFLMQLPLSIKKAENMALKVSNATRPLILEEQGPVNKLKDILPFQLTNAQKRVIEEIKADLIKPMPMNRLVQGDVGSGKTVVAMLTMLMAIERGQQAALMAPTEILAEQHFRKFRDSLLELGLRVSLLIGSQKAAERREVITGLANGQIPLVVGTHALIQSGVEFANLGLAVIDEQHRFGVKQRDFLRRKGSFVDSLFMTATPIPRTLALALYGNLDLSEIDELPAGRKPIQTRLVQGRERKAAHEFVKKQLAEGRQAYIVYPLIEESESLSAKAVIEEAIKLEKTYENYKIGIVHGKLSVEQKDQVMNAFRKNEIQVLIGTTVIEVGVDVPNATIMIIENAERFGLSQLHQLRGRVGRGIWQSYCFLFADANSAATEQRLHIMEQTENGFIIAQQDLKIRGPGEFLGTRQSGLSDFGLESLATHGEILEKAKSAADDFVTKDPNLKNIPNALARRLDLIKQKAELLDSG